MYLTTVPDDPRYVIGVKFLDLRPKAQQIIDRFFDEKLYEYFAGDAVAQTA